MRTHIGLILAGILTLALAGGCNGTEQQSGDDGTGGGALAAAPNNSTASSPSATRTGRVVETMDAGGYTYVKVVSEGREEWYAAPKFQVAVGETVSVPTNAMAMRDFESPTLGRTFDVVYFTSAIAKVGGSGAAAAVREAHTTAPEPSTAVDLNGIAPAEGGMTVAEIHQTGKAAAGQTVVLRGKVVKYNAGIMGKNWLHVRDGTGGDGTNDITVTTNDTAKVGDTVLVKGKLAADRDFGFGYEYALIIEEAVVVVE